MTKDEHILQLEENLAIEKNKSDYYILAFLLLNRVNELEYTMDELTRILEVVEYLGIGASMVDGTRLICRETIDEERYCAGLDGLINNVLNGTNKKYIGIDHHKLQKFNFSYNIKVTNQETIVRTKYQNKFGDKIKKVKKFKL